jgi:hypothetical protein
MTFHIACEIILLCACLWAAMLSARRGGVLAALGFTLIGVASALGVLEYAGMESVADIHRTASRISGRLSLACIALDALRLRGIWLAFAAAAALILLPWLPAPAALAVNVGALCGIVYGHRQRGLKAAIAGALLFMLAGIAIGTKGQWQGVARVDLYHLALALAVVCWACIDLSGKRSARLSSSA